MKSWSVSVAVLLSAGWLAGSGCSQQSRIAHHLKQADRHYQAGRLDKAEMEYLMVLREDPKNARATRNLGLLHSREGRFESAIRLLSLAKEMLPNDLEVRLQAAYALAGLRGFREAQADALQVLRQSPTNDEAIVLWPDLAGPNQLADFRAVLADCRQRGGDRPTLHLALGSLAAKAGDLASAEKEYLEALRLNPADGSAHLGLATLCLARHDPTNAEIHLKRMAALEPADSPRRLRLVDFKLNSGATEEARKMLLDLTVKMPYHVAPWRYLANLEFAQQNWPECKTALKKLLARSPLNLDGLMLQARLKCAQGQFAEAATDLERMTTVYPNNPVIYYQLGQAQFRNNDPAKALTALDRALALEPTFLDAMLAKAEVNLRRGDFAAVVTTMSALHLSHPGVVQVDLMLAEALRLRGTPAEALAVYQRLCDATPTEPRFPYLKGTLLRSMQRPEEARNCFEQVLRMAPANLEALSQLAEMDLAAGQPQSALQRVRQQIVQQPKSLPHQLLLAEIHLRQKQFDQAEALLQKLSDAQPGSSAISSLLARTYAEANKHPQALAKLEAALAKNPKNVPLLLQKAVILSAAKDYDQARSTYESLLRIAPQSVETLNDLACLCSEYLGKLDRALHLAQEARRLAPRDPAVADTLGWVLFKRREYPRALSLLREAAEALGSLPEIQYHLGLAHYMTGQEAQARAALELALQSPVAFHGRGEASQWLACLKVAAEPADPKNAPEQEKQVKEALAVSPGNLAALMAQARLLERRGETTTAVKSYQAILSGGHADFPPAVRRLALLYANQDDAPHGFPVATRAREAYPADPEVARALAKFNYLRGDFAAAGLLFKEVSQNRPQEAESWYWQAMTAARLKEKDQAETAFNKALALDPKHPLATEARRLLQTLP